MRGELSSDDGSKEKVGMAIDVATRKSGRLEREIAVGERRQKEEHVRLGVFCLIRWGSRSGSVPCPLQIKINPPSRTPLVLPNTDPNIVETQPNFLFGAVRLFLFCLGRKYAHRRKNFKEAT